MVVTFAEYRQRLIVAGLLLLMAGCATQPAVEPAAETRGSSPRSLPADPVPRPEPRSRYGNGPVYEVYGRRYEVMDSDYGYLERGVASWYGKKFHGRPTSSREPYDMYEMTAAHKSLPLPSYVEVRNLKNNRRVVVRVNDRGPFVKNRLIDLSYAAALKLDIVRDGTGMVEVRAISFDEPPPVETASAPPAPAAQPVVAPAETPATAPSPASRAGEKVYVQVGAFGERSNAERRHRLLTDSGINAAFVHREADRTPAIYRVRIGPLAGVEHYDRVVSELSRIGIDDSHLVTE